METIKDKIKRVLEDKVELQNHRKEWKALFEEEKENLLKLFPDIRRVEHFGSTAVDGLIAKPIIDILCEVDSVKETDAKVPLIMEPLGYDYFFRPTFGDDEGPFYPWLIKRNKRGERTHHIHMVEKNFPHWERILFRDYLRKNKGIRDQYAKIKMEAVKNYRNDRVGYTKAKTEFILRITEKAKKL